MIVAFLKEMAYVLVGVVVDNLLPDKDWHLG
jgi:hypothetical protein